MSRPPKPFSVISSERKSHRTKAEMEAREKGEAAFATGEALKEKPETKENITAHKEFLRLKKLFTNIGKWDAIYENIINRYCLLYAECKDFEEKRERFYKDLWEMENDKDEGCFNEKISTYYKLKNQIQENIINLDKQVQAKRKMMMDIEKESIMTIAAALRSVPKKEEKAENPLLEALKDG